MDIKEATRRSAAFSEGLLGKIRSSLNDVQDGAEFATPEYKSLASRVARLSPEVIEFKVGIFQSHTRLGRLGQALGSYALPGDTSKLRNPVRSGGRSAATPGGPPGLGARLRPRSFLRCPPGYENGGRFAQRGLSNCGRRLFVPGEVSRVADLANGPDSPKLARRFRGGKPGDGEGIAIGGKRGVGDPVQVSRMARIPEPKAANLDKKTTSINKAVASVRKDPKKSLFVREDGEILRSSVPLSVLARQKNNKDMKGGTIVAATQSRAVGRAEFPALINSSAKGLVLALPGRGELTISQNRPLSASEKLAVSAAMRAGTPEAIVSAIDASGGALKLKIDGIPGGDKTVRIKPAGGGPSRMVPVWVYNTYLQRNAPARQGRDIWILVRDK